MLSEGAESHGFEGPKWTAARVATMIARHFHVRYHPHHVAKLLRRAAWSFKKIELVATEHDDKHIRRWMREQWPALRARADRENRTLVFLDESAFYLAPLASYSWSPRGKPLQVRGKLRSRHLSVIGAMTWEGRLFLNVHRDGCHGKEVIIFLRHLLSHLPGRLLLVWDNGPIHRCKEVQEFLSLDSVGLMVVESFPPYAPEVDPQEYVWRRLKYDDLLNRTTYSFDVLEANLRKAAQRLRRKVAILRAFLRHAGLDG